MFDDLPTDPRNKGLQFAGAVDRISPTDGIQGWALDTQNPSSSIEIQVWCGGFILASTHTGLQRPDVSAVIKAECKSGFTVSWQSFDPAYVQQLLAGREHEPVHVLVPTGKGALVYVCDPPDLASLYLLIAAAKTQKERATGVARPAISQTATLVTLAVSVHFDTMSGSLTVASREPGEGYDIFVDGKFSGVRHLALQSSPIGRINRLTDSEFAGPTLNWQADNVPVSKNLSPEWTLEGANTAYLRGIPGENEKPVVAIFTCPTDGISRLYRDEKTWNAMSKSVQELAASRYSFKAGVAALQDALAAIDFFVPGDRSALHANSARPVAPAAARPTHETKEFTGAVKFTHKELRA